jgi:hypothetical protein
MQLHLERYSLKKYKENSEKLCTVVMKPNVQRHAHNNPILNQVL